MITALIGGHSFGDVVRDFGPMFALVGVAVTLFVNGAREERRRRREIHARALEAIARYYEMPFLIRRRRHDEPSAERVRLTERFADVQAELASCEALMRADPDPAVRKAYAALVTPSERMPACRLPRHGTRSRSRPTPRWGRATSSPRWYPSGPRERRASTQWRSRQRRATARSGHSPARVVHRASIEPDTVDNLIAHVQTRGSQAGPCILLA